MDVDGAKENLEKFKKKVPDIKIFPISAVLKTGIDEVLIELANMLDKIAKKPLYEESKYESHILYKFKSEKPYHIYKEGNTWVIRGKEVEKLLKMTRFTSDEAVVRFTTKLRRMGIDEDLRKMGAQEGDNVRILDLEFDYKE